VWRAHRSLRLRRIGGQFPSSALEVVPRHLGYLGFEVLEWQAILVVSRTVSQSTSVQLARRPQRLGCPVRGSDIFEVVPRDEFSEFRWTGLLDLPVPDALQPSAALLAAGPSSWRTRFPAHPVSVGCLPARQAPGECSVANHDGPGQTLRPRRGRLGGASSQV
jgi:hypothetical protein